MAEVTNGVTSWNASRPTGYGAVPGYRPAAFANGADMAQSSAWRGREVDITGLYNIGSRPFDPVSGRWLTFDSAWNSGDPDGYTFCGAGDPVNYFDADGRFGKQYAQYQYNGGVLGYGLRDLAGVFNNVGASSSSTYLSFGAYNDASLLNLAANTITPASYVNGYQNLQNRAENVMVGEYLNGSGNTWAAAQGLSSIVGDSIGYNNIYEASFNVDRQTLTSLSGADRWSRGLMGGSQLILAGTGLRAAYNPGATFVGTSFAGVPPILPKPGQIIYGDLDALGRPTGISSTLTQDMLGTGTRPSQSIIPPGFQGGAVGQSRGHLLGAQLGGSGQLPQNLVAILQNPANTPVMRGFENQTAAAVRAGQTVNYSAIPIYQGDNLVPSGITIMASGSGGFRLSVTVLNPIP